jgi:POLQ-like helicase
VKLLRLLQKQIKYGLAAELAIAFYELGFTDRVLSQELAILLEGATSRTRILRRLSEKREVALSVLGKYPSYFTFVFENLFTQK